MNFALDMALQRLKKRKAQQQEQAKITIPVNVGTVASLMESEVVQWKRGPLPRNVFRNRGISRKCAEWAIINGGLCTIERNLRGSFCVYYHGPLGTPGSFHKRSDNIVTAKRDAANLAYKRFDNTKPKPSCRHVHPGLNKGIVQLLSPMTESAQTKQFNDLCLDATSFFEQRADDTVDLPADSHERSGVEAAIGLLKQYKLDDSTSNDEVRDKTLLLADKFSELFKDRESDDEVKLFSDKFIEGMREFHNQIEGGEEEAPDDEGLENDHPEDQEEPGMHGEGEENSDQESGEEFQNDLEQEIEPYSPHGDQASQGGRAPHEHRDLSTLHRKVRHEAYARMAKLSGLFTEGRLISQGFTRQQVSRAISAGLFEQIAGGTLRTIPNWMRPRKLAGLYETDPTQNYVNGEFQPGQSYQHIKDGQTRNLQVLRVDNGVPVFIDPNDTNKGEVNDVDAKDVSPAPVDNDGKPAAPTSTTSNPPAAGLGESFMRSGSRVSRFAGLFE